MKKTLLTLIGCLLAGLSAAAQNAPEAFRLYNAQGKSTTWAAMMDDLAGQDVVFVGEMHNCVVCHWLEKLILKELYKKHGSQLAVGMEMFESDDQLIIDEYFRGQITAERFEAEARFWPNYETDYEPLVDFAHEHHLPLVATNVPRRYANAVKNHGLDALDSLSNEAKGYLPPLPIAYQSNEQANEGFNLMAMMGKGKSTNPEWLAQSQALKDATMAWNIAQQKGRKVVHFNGNYHSDADGGIITYLKLYAPERTYKTIYSVRQEDISVLEADYLGHGDYYICVPEDMVTSY